MIYTVYIYSNPLQNDQLGGWGDIFKTIGAIGLGTAPAIVPSIPGLSNTVRNIISTGAQVASQFLGSLNTSGGQARGLAAINAFGQKVLAQFPQLAQAAQQGMSRAEVYQAADGLVAVLNDKQYVYQAERGKDAEALEAFKAQAKNLAAQVKQLADTLAGQTTTTGTTTTGTTTTDTSFLDGAFTNYLFLGGGILLVVWWLKS